MVKLLFLGFWSILLLSGSVFLSAKLNQPTQMNGETEEAANSNLEYVKVEPLSVSIVRNGEVKGYLIVEAAYAMNSLVFEGPHKPIEYLMRDSIISVVHESSGLDIYKTDRFELPGFKKNVRERINKKIGVEAINQILIQRIEFISKEDIRDIQLRRS